MSESTLLEAMIGAAVEAGRAIQRFYENGFQVRNKADSTPVTDADQAAQTIILARLAERAPGLTVVAEEEVAAGRVPAPAEEFVLVDPLDGTKEFIARRGEFTVNIALVRRAAPQLGVVYAPASALLFAADVAAEHAFVSEQHPDSAAPAPRRAIRVRSVPPVGITAVASRSHATPETDAYLARYRVAERVAIGSSLKFCLIAQGKADLYPRMGATMEWDTAAGHAVLLGAGGCVIARDGKPLAYGKPQYRNPWFVASGTLVPERMAQ
ncbi:MAG TPA: 3'(2'),5'-bisphosphate nucleotidase CysQ [Steroidobacteraceae bacterium]|nr:3'(2'),5'-bisphosphate nucleotidase CysQ [Steroidobacteraceae bacterium]